VGGSCANSLKQLSEPARSEWRDCDQNDQNLISSDICLNAAKSLYTEQLIYKQKAK
jgi:hypothetical protein